MTLDDLVSPSAIAAIKRHGLHKVAGAMRGLPELGIHEAVAAIGERAYLRRKEARIVVDGLSALSALSGEKVAENPALMALLRRAVMPAALGAGIGGVAHSMGNDRGESPLMSMGAGALMGGVGGGIGALNSATRGPLGSQLAHAIGALP